MRSSSPLRRKLAVVAFSLVLVAALVGRSQAQTIYWGNAVGQGLADSTSEPLTKTWNFEMGVFKPGFIPTSENIAKWVENWVPLDTADYNEGAKYFASKMPAIEPHHAGLQAYMWIYNERKYNSSSEWLLITDRDGSHSNDWMLPNPSTEPTAVIVNWRISNATTVLMGRADRVAKADAATGKSKAEKVFATSKIPGPAIAAALKADPEKPAATAVAGDVKEEFTD